MIEKNEKRNIDQFRAAEAGRQCNFGETQSFGLGAVISADDLRPKKGAFVGTLCRSGKQSFTSSVLTHGS